MSRSSLDDVSTTTGTDRVRGSLRICRSRAREDDDVALVFAQLGERRLRTGISALLDRRLVVVPMDLVEVDVGRA